MHTHMHMHTHKYFTLLHTCKLTFTHPHIHTHTYTHTYRHNQVNLVTSNSLWLELGQPLPPEVIEVSPRVGVDSAGQKWALAPLRFFQSGCGFVSRARSKATPTSSRTGYLNRTAANQHAS